MNQQQFSQTDQAIDAWNQLTFWLLADEADNPPDVVHVDPRQAPTRCPLCRAAMPAGDMTCPACGMEIDL